MSYIHCVGAPRLARGRRSRVIVRTAREGRDGLIVADLAGVIREEVAMANYAKLRQEAERYYDLTARARAVGIDTTATDETAVDPHAVEKLRAAVELAEVKR